MSKPIISAITLVLLGWACKPDAGNNTAGKPVAASADTITTPQDTPRGSPDSLSSTFTYEIIDAPEGTFGYNILMDGKLVIRQTNIPGMPGLKGFSKKENAVKVAELVMGKLRNNEMPPTVTEGDLKEIKVVE